MVRRANRSQTFMVHVAGRKGPPYWLLEMREL